MAQQDTDPRLDRRIYVSATDLMRLGGKAGPLSLLPHQPARSILNGRHASRLRGRGLNFEELRNYLPGDDVRTIDWKVTARTGEPHVRVYTEERDRPALVLVDQRMSMFFGSVTYMKSVIAAEAAAIIADRVLKQGDRIGGIVFGDDAVAEHRPQRRPAALRRFLSSVAEANALLHPGHAGPGTVHLNDVLKTAARIAKTNTLVMIISDFDGLNADSEKLIRRLSQTNDVILFNVADNPDGDLALNARLAISDGQLQAELDLGDERTRAKVQAALKGRLSNLFEWSRKYNISVAPLNTLSPALDQLLYLFGHHPVSAGGCRK